MVFDQSTVRTLYKKLLSFYPKGFREQFADAIEQTFNDLWNEKRQSKKELIDFVLWSFLDTAMGIFREHQLFMSQGDLMHTILKPLGLSSSISFLLILPFIIMEVVNRRNLNQEFPFALFFILWLNMFAISLILLPIARGWWMRNRETANPVSAQGTASLANPKVTAIVSIALFLIPVILFFLTSLGWEPLDRVFNGPNPEEPYIPGQIIVLGLISIPIASGIVAGKPIVSALRAGRSLFTYPLHLLIVALIAVLFAAGVVNLLIDQWPCFMGVPNCD